MSQSSSLARVTPDQIAKLSGSSRDPRAISATLRWAAEHCHVVSPATTCETLPEGYEISTSVVLVDAREARDGGDIYSVGGGKFGLGKTSLERIGDAAGIEWDPGLSRRLDDGRDPHYCEFLAVGWRRVFDGSRKPVSGRKVMDLRDGSATCEKLHKEAKSGDGSTQIREQRHHILAHAESKARLRAIRSGLALKAGYVKADLEKPFVIAKASFTGYSDDPELRKEAFRASLAAHHASAAALYGPPSAPTSAPLLPAAATEPRYAAPPVSQAPPDDDDDPPGDDDAAPAEVAPMPAGFAERFTVPFGKSKGKKLAECTDADLAWMDKTFGENVEDPEKANFREKNTWAQLAVRGEIARRAAPPAAAREPGAEG